MFFKIKAMCNPQTCSVTCTYRVGLYTDKKENQIFLIYKKFHNGAVTKTYMRNGFLLYEELRKYLRKPLVTYDFGNCSILNFLIYEENLILFFISVVLSFPPQNISRQSQQNKQSVAKIGDSTVHMGKTRREKGRQVARLYWLVG